MCLKAVKHPLIYSLHGKYDKILTISEFPWTNHDGYTGKVGHSDQDVAVSIEAPTLILMILC